MQTKTKVILGITAILTAFSFGRFSAPVKTVTETKVVEVEKKTEDKDITDHKKVVIVKNKDGSSTTTVTDDRDSKSKQTDNTQVSSDTTKITIKEGARTTITAMAGVSITQVGTPIYGASVSRTIMGPIAIGAFGLSNGVGGVTLGLNF